MGPREAGARERDAAVSATARAGCGRGRDGRGLWSGGRVAGGSRECHGSVTDVGPRHTDAGDVTLPPVFSRPRPDEFAVLPALRGELRTRPSPGLPSRPDGP